MHSIDHIEQIKASADDVFAALSTEKGLAAVWTETLVVRPEPGFINEFDFNDGYSTKMKIVEFEPPLHIRWECVASDPEWVGTFIGFNIRPVKPGKVMVELQHGGWREKTDFFKNCNYNWAMFLFSLKGYCEDGVGLNFQQRKW
ncbi:SRPBCC family protein [Chitinophaga lutea]